GGRQVLGRGTGSDGVGTVLIELGQSAGDRRGEIVRNGDRLKDPADLRADRADRHPVVRIQARQLIEPIVDRRYLRHDPAERRRGHAEASRHVDAVDPGEPTQARGLATNERDLRLVNLVETQHILLDQRVTSEASVRGPADDSAARPGSCGKPPSTLYVKK